MLAKAKRDRAELANSYMPLPIRVVPSYSDIGSGKSWDQIQEHFRLSLWQERCKILTADNVKDAEKSLKDAQGRLNSFDEQTNKRKMHMPAQCRNFAKKQKNLKRNWQKYRLLFNAGPPAMPVSSRVDYLASLWALDRIPQRS